MLNVGHWDHFKESKYSGKKCKHKNVKVSQQSKSTNTSKFPRKALLTNINTQNITESHSNCTSLKSKPVDWKYARGRQELENGQCVTRLHGILDFFTCKHWKLPRHHNFELYFGQGQSAVRRLIFSMTMKKDIHLSNFLHIFYVIVFAFLDKFERIFQDMRIFCYKSNVLRNIKNIFQDQVKFLRKINITLMLWLIRAREDHLLRLADKWICVLQLVTNGKIDIQKGCFLVFFFVKLRGRYLAKRVALLVTPFTSKTKLVAGFGAEWTHWMEKLVGRRGGGGR